MLDSYRIKLSQQIDHGTKRWRPESEKNYRKPTNLIAWFLSNFDHNQTFTPTKLELVQKLHIDLLQEAEKMGEGTLESEALKLVAGFFKLECPDAPFSLDKIKGENKPTEEDWQTRMQEIAYKYDL